MVMEQKKNRRSLRTALVLGAAVAGTALVGFGGLAAWQAYTQNAGNAFAVGTLSHTNEVNGDVHTLCSSTITSGAPAACSVIVSGPTLTSDWLGSNGTVTITAAGTLNSTFAMSMPAAPTGGSLCGDLTLKVTDNESPAHTPYATTSLSARMGSTAVLASNGDGTVVAPWLPGDSGTFTFAVTPTSTYATDDNVLGSTCSFDILITQASA